MRVELRLVTGIMAICLANGLVGCGGGDSPRESSGSSAQRSADGTGTPVAEKRTVAAPSSDALGGASTATPAANSTPASSSGGNSPQPIDPVVSEGATMPMSDTPKAAAPAVLTPKTNDTSASADGACYKAAVTVCQLEQAILRLTNAHRPGDQQLKLDAKLSFVARAWSGQQQILGVIGHTGFPDLREAGYMTEFGVAMPYFLGAENVGTTYGTDKLTIDQLAAEIVDMWWMSAGHKANILGDYQVIGIGVSISADARTVMATQLFGAE